MQSFKKFLLLITEQSVRVAIFLFVRTFRFFPAFKNVSIATVIDLLRSSRGLVLPEEIELRISENADSKAPNHSADLSSDFSNQLSSALTIVYYTSADEYEEASLYVSVNDRPEHRFSLVSAYSCSHQNDHELEGNSDSNWLIESLKIPNSWNSVVIVSASSLNQFSMNDIRRMHIQNLANENSIINSFRVVASPIGPVQWGFDVFKTVGAKYIDTRMWGFSKQSIGRISENLDVLSGSITTIAANLSLMLASRGILINCIPVEIRESISRAIRLDIGCEKCWQLCARHNSDLRTLRFRSLPINHLLPVNFALPVESGKQRILLVQPIGGGGLPATTAQLSRQLEKTYDVFTLTCQSDRVRLSFGADQTHELFTVGFQNPVEPFSHRSSEYDYLFATVLGLLNIDIIQIEHMAWQSLGITEITTFFSIPYFFTFHDYYSVCASHNLLDEKLVFCGGVCTAGDGFCQTALWPKYELRSLKNGLVHRWQSQMGGFLAGTTGMFVPSVSAATDLKNVFHDLEHKIRIAPHATSVSFELRKPNRASKGDELNVLVLGDIGPHKGEYKVRELADLSDALNINVHLLGPHRSLLSEKLINHGAYSVSDLKVLVDGIDPDIALLPSITHETFSHALTELISLGIPIAAFSGSGAVEERVVGSGVGVIIDPTESPRQWLKQIREEIFSDASFELICQNIEKWQATNSNFTSELMAAKYIKEYENALKAKR